MVVQLKDWQFMSHDLSHDLSSQYSGMSLACLSMGGLIMRIVNIKERNGMCVDFILYFRNVCSCFDLQISPGWSQNSWSLSL